MPLHLLVPAVASAIALAVVLVVLHLISQAVTDVHSELQQSRTMAVAADELMQTVSALNDHAERTRVSADRALSGLSMSARIIRRCLHR